MPRRLLFLLAAPFVLGGCIHVSMDPVQVNANINVNIKVDKALDDFFGDLDKKSATLNAPAAKS